MVHLHLVVVLTALMESMNILQILATALSVDRPHMVHVLTVRSASTCMAATVGSVSSVDQLQQVPVQTVHMENMKDN